MLNGKTNCTITTVAVGINGVKQGIYPLRYYLDSVNMYKCGCVYQVSRPIRILVVRDLLIAMVVT